MIAQNHFTGRRWLKLFTFIQLTKRRQFISTCVFLARVDYQGVPPTRCRWRWLLVNNFTVQVLSLATKKPGWQMQHDLVISTGENCFAFVVTGFQKQFPGSPLCSFFSEHQWRAIFLKIIVEMDTKSNQQKYSKNFLLFFFRGGGGWLYYPLS